MQHGVGVALHGVGEAVAQHAGIRQVVDGLRGVIGAGSAAACQSLEHRLAGRLPRGRGGLGEVLLKFFLRVHHVRMHHQRVAQAVLLCVQHVLVRRAEALVIHLDARVAFHYRSAQVAVHQQVLGLAAQEAQRAFAVQFDRVPYGDGVNVVSHVTSMARGSTRTVLVRCRAGC